MSYFFRTTLGRAVLGLAFAITWPTQAADVSKPDSTPPSSAFVSELRLGISAHDSWSPEKGSANITGEILFAKPFILSSAFNNYLIPRLHLGGSVNTNSKTSFVYTGFSWTYDLTERVFVEGTLGGALHDGKTGDIVPLDRSALGCSPLFRESASLGYRIASNWLVMGTVEHLSNAGLCSQNRGLTNVGARLGYVF